MADFEDGISYEEGQGFLKEQLDAEDVVYQIDMYLSGGAYDYAKKAYIHTKEKDFKPLLNSTGRQKVCTILRARISNINQYSKLSQLKVDIIRGNIQEDLWWDLCINCEKYDFDINNLSILLNIVDDSIDLFLSRTVNGGFLSWVGRIFKVGESYNEEGSKTKGVFGGR